MYVSFNFYVAGALLRFAGNILFCLVFGVFGDVESVVVQRHCCTAVRNDGGAIRVP